jgi:hypothetical protein
MKHHHLFLKTLDRRLSEACNASIDLIHYSLPMPQLLSLVQTVESSYLVSTDIIEAAFYLKARTIIIWRWFLHYAEEVFMDTIGCLESAGSESKMEEALRMGLWAAGQLLITR